MKTTLSFGLFWLPSALIITLFAGLIYLVVQQDMRQSANDPQIQVAEDMSRLLASGIAPQAIISNGTQTDVSQSLATFATIYDSSGNSVVSTGALGTSAPILPQGVFTYTQNHQEDRLTWEPQKGVRLAAIVEYYKSPTSSGFVLVARSIREVEKRESTLGWEVFAVWIVALLISFGTSFVRYSKKYVAVRV